MKKTLIFVSTFLFFLINAQNNETLQKEFEQQNKSNTQKFNTYISKRYSPDKKAENRKKIDEQRKNLAGFDPDGKPYFYQTSDMNQILNSNSDHLQDGTISGLTGSFNGENIKFTVFDGGRVFEHHFLFNNAPNRISNKESSIMNYNAHATEVTGLIGARDYPISDTLSNGTIVDILNFRGIAQNATFDNYSFQNTALPSNPDTLTVFQKILIAQPKISNHSYGTAPGWLFMEVNGSFAWLWNGSYNEGISYDLLGTYHMHDQNFDRIVYTNPSYIMVKAAGNEYGSGPGDYPVPKYYKDSTGNYVAFTSTDPLPENNCASGYDCIGVGSLAKNIIVVGATDLITTNGGRYVSLSDVVRSSYSSAGPRDDGGIKPDISTTGTDVISASTPEDTVGDNDVVEGMGTSYSAPVVTGIIGLWAQINKQLFNTELNAASAKTLMIHSASEAGNIGPDPLFGWGYIDAKKGAELLVGKSNNAVIFDNETLNSGITNQKIIQATGNNPLKVTISWVDPAFTNIPTTMAATHNNRTSRLINDLDLRIIDMVTNTVYYPWKLDANSPLTPATKADNTVDNVEQVVIDTPVAGRDYRIEISNKGNLVNDSDTNAPQNYSIIATGHTDPQLLATHDITKVTNSIIVVPTITKDIVKILKAPNNSTFNIYDLSGKKLKSGIIKNQEENIDFSSYTKGIYIIEIKTEKGNISKKIIKE